MTNAEILKEVNRDIPPDIAARYADDALFIAYGCVLLEHDTGREYRYKAINLSTGRGVQISRRKRPVALSGIPELVSKIKQSPIAGASRFDVDVRAGAGLFRDRLTEIQDYIFMELLPSKGYGVREKQIELARHILGAMSARAVTMAEAEVGTGKTHAYLIAAILSKRGRLNDYWLRGKHQGKGHAAPVVVSTSSIALQNAIVNDYIPEISALLMEYGILQKPLTCVIRKGKEHYACEKNLKAFYMDTDARTQRVLAPLFTARSVDLADVQGLTPYMKRKICVPGRCWEDCTQAARCRFQQYLKMAQSGRHDFQVCNHNYFLADLKRRKQGQPPLIPNYQAVVIDEGHKFLDATRQMYGDAFNAAAVAEVADEVLDIKYRKGFARGGIDALATGLAGQGKRLFRQLEKNIPAADYDDEAERFKTVIDSAAARRLQKIAHMAGQLELSLKECKPTKRHEDLCRQAAWKLRNIAQRADFLAEHHKLVYWLEKPARGKEGDASLCSIPKHLNQILAEDLWSLGIPIVLTSGTLSASGDFTHIKRVLGLDKLPPHRLMEASKPSPFDYQKNAMLYISESVPFPNVQDAVYIKEVTAEVERLVRASHGHAAVLFTSYKAMDMVFHRLSALGFPFPLLRLDRGGAGAIQRFRESGNGVLFASGALWEGIDLPGDILSMLIIVKLPFAVPDPIGEYEQTLYGSMDEYKRRVVVPGMIIKLKQGFGRLIRSEIDTGVVALLDSRARLDGGYRARVLAALPQCRVVKDIPTVERFFKEKKGPGYFT